MKPETTATGRSSSSRSSKVTSWLLVVWTRCTRMYQLLLYIPGHMFLRAYYMPCLDSSVYITAYLSDFFYVWLKRSVGDIYPDLFSTPLTPKAGEIVAYTRPEGGFEAGKRFFEENLKLSFQEMQRVLKMGGIAIVVYAHKSTEG